MGADILDQAGLRVFPFSGFILSRIRIAGRFQIRQIGIDAFHIFVQLAMGFRQGVKSIPHVSQHIQDSQDQLMAVLARVQLHALRQALQIADPIRQSAHDYALFRYSPVRVSIWILSPVLMNSGTCRLKPVSRVAGL